MVGEMRDHETAEIAMQASLTGHMVLSTIHTNDATSTIVRLADLGIKPYLIASSLNGVIAQRLVRVICNFCKEKYDPGIDELVYLRLKANSETPFSFYRGRGCDHCKKTGYVGRTGIFEVLPISSRIKEMIVSKASEAEIRYAAIAEGMRTLGGDALEKVKMGITTMDELKRVAHLEGDAATLCSCCGKILAEDFAVCPYCGHSIETICPNCRKHRASDWVVCPYCKTNFT